MLIEYLAPLFSDDPLILVDVGALWGIDKKWNVFGNSLRAYCFEPNIEECERLNINQNIIYIPEALAGLEGNKSFFHTRYPPSSGFYETNQEFFGRLINRTNAEIVREEDIAVRRFEDVRVKYAIPDPDFIKLDVEGAELDILRTSRLGCVFGIYSEFRFHKAINGCPTFSEMDQHLTSRGFMLYDLTFSKQSRKALPYPGLKMTLPSGERFHAATIGGQVMDGDALYFRDPLKLKLNRNQILKAVCLFELFNQFDSAAELLIEKANDVDVDIDMCLDMLIGTSYKIYMENY